MTKNLIIFALLGRVLLAQGGANCKSVGGAVLTNFLDSTTTLGTATGDLKGGLGVTVLSSSQGPNGTLVLLNQHHWVTESGDTVLFNDANATAFPSGIPGLYTVSYTNGVKVAGGTGRFAGAAGKILVFGAADLNKGQIILRYEGQVCFSGASD